MSATKIEWADMTVNPIVGCSKCSPGCDNCYAERMAARLAKNPKTAEKYAGVVDDAGKWTGKINFDNSCFYSLPKKPRHIFIGSMCDMFHENVDHGILSYCLMTINTMLRQHIFMLLTKRPEKMKEVITKRIYQGRNPVMGNLWLGVTVCNQTEADEKIPILLQTPAAKRFVSIEPMLGPVDLDKDEFLSPWRSQDGASQFLDWVICGGETGPDARPTHPDWVRPLRDQCAAAGVPFFFKGWATFHQCLGKPVADSLMGANITPFLRSVHECIAARNTGPMLRRAHVVVQ